MSTRIDIEHTEISEGYEPPLPVRLVASTVRAWALAGGVLALGLAVMTAGSAISNLTIGRPFAADHELVKHLIAIVVFTFLPYCQLIGANVTVDIFTEGMRDRAKAAMASIASLLAIGLAVLLMRQMWLGFGSYLRFVEVTPVLGLPLWTAFPPILISLVLLVFAALVTLANALRGVLGHASWQLGD